MMLRLVAMLLPTLAALQLATQQIAATYHYHAALGAPLVGHWYAPWHLPQWVWHWGATQPGLYRGPLYVVLGGVVVGMVGSVLVRWCTPKQPAQTSYGSAAWGAAADIKRSGLL